MTMANERDPNKSPLNSLGEHKNISLSKIWHHYGCFLAAVWLYSQHTRVRGLDTIFISLELLKHPHSREKMDIGMHCIKDYNHRKISILQKTEIKEEINKVGGKGKKRGKEAMTGETVASVRALTVETAGAWQTQKCKDKPR